MKSHCTKSPRIALWCLKLRWAALTSSSHGLTTSPNDGFIGSPASTSISLQLDSYISESFNESHSISPSVSLIYLTIPNSGVTDYKVNFCRVYKLISRIYKLDATQIAVDKTVDHVENLTRSGMERTLPIIIESTIVDLPHATCYELSFCESKKVEADLRCPVLDQFLLHAVSILTRMTKKLLKEANKIYR